MTKRVWMREFNDQPTIYLLYRSITTARYNQPSFVQIQVMSDTQTRLGAMGKGWLLSVVTRYFFLCLAETPAHFINVRAWHRPHHMPWNFNSLDMRRVP